MAWTKTDQDRAERAWFLEQVYQHCEQFNGSVHSWVRSIERNRDVGGKDTSLHLSGLAVDVAYPDMDTKMDATADIKGRGLHWWDSKPDSTSLHIQARGATPKPRGTDQV